MSLQKTVILLLVIISSHNLRAANSPDNRAAAMVDNQIITYQQVFDSVGEQIYAAEMKLYEIKLNQIKSILLSRLIASHPFSKGMTPDAFLNQFVIKDQSVTEQEIESFIKIKRIADDKLNPEVRKKIREYIINEKARVAIESWLLAQGKEHGVVINLEKPKRPRYTVEIGNAPVIGNKNAEITIVEFSDYQCPYCAQAEPTIKKLLKKHGKNIRLVYKNYPLSFHGEAFLAAEAGLCAHEQSEDYFWQLHDKMLADPRGLKMNGIKDKAKSIGLNVVKFEACLTEKKYHAQVNRDIAQGNKLGVSSTPAFFINGVLVLGNKPYAEFENIINEELGL